MIWFVIIAIVAFAVVPKGEWRSGILIFCGLFLVMNVFDAAKDSQSDNIKYITGCFISYEVPARAPMIFKADTEAGIVSFNTYKNMEEDTNKVEVGKCGKIGYFMFLNQRYLKSFSEQQLDNKTSP